MSLNATVLIFKHSSKRPTVECQLRIDCAGPCHGFVEALLRSGSRFDAFVIYAMGSGQQAKPSATRVRCPVDCQSLILFESREVLNFQIP